MEAKFQSLQCEHHGGVSSFLQRDDYNNSQHRREFWDDRQRLDTQTENMSVQFQTDVLQEWRFLLMPLAQEAEARSSASAQFTSWTRSEAVLADLEARLPTGSSCLWMLSLLYWAAEEMQHSEVSSVLASLTRPLGVSASELDRLAASLKSHRTALANRSGKIPQLPLLLFVDSEVAQFPLEVCPCFRSLQVVRGVAGNVALTAFHQNRCSSQDAASASRVEAAAGTGALLPHTLLRKCLRDRSSRSTTQDTGMVPRALPKTGFYVLDPLKDASCSQAKLRALLGKWTTWAGSVGQPFPESSELFHRLASEDVFIYMGHGGKCMRQLLKPEALQMGASASDTGGLKGSNRSSDSKTPAPKVPLRSVVMLMGCSTAKISRHPMLRSSPASSEDTSPRARCIMKTRSGATFEAFGTPLNVLIGGAPAVVGALWDVLGGDLEQLVCSMLEAWVQGSHSEKRFSHSSFTPVSLLRALVEARKACRLRFLTGAAVVCYGIPM